MKKVLIVGLDGGTFRIIKPLVAQGKLPAFRFLLKNGAHGILKSTIPFLTVPAWPSFYTGKNPGKHGLFDFLTVHNFSPLERRVQSANDVKSKTLWQILSENKRRSLVWNVPLTYPAQEINGILVGGMLSVPDKIYTYPADLTSELRKRQYLIDTMILDFKKLPEEEHFKIMLECERKRFEIWKEFYQSQNWDFSIIVFRSTDIVGHEFWHDKNKVFLVYKQMDEILEKILKIIDKDTTLLLMSDHGFKDYTETFNILAWLKKEHFLTYAATTDNENTATKSWRQIHNNENENKSLFGKILLKLGFDRQRLMQSRAIDVFRKITPKFIKNKVRKNLPSSKRTIDWTKTVAYAQLGAKSTWGININLKGREKYGIIAPESYKIIRDQLMEKLKKVKSPNGINVFSNVYGREDLYSGPYINEAPDILFLLNNENCLATARFDDNLFSKSTSHTNRYHDQDGIFFAYQEAMGEKPELQNLSILDVAPTVLNILDIENQEGMDGKVIREVI